MPKQGSSTKLTRKRGGIYRLTQALDGHLEQNPRNLANRGSDNYHFALPLLKILLDKGKGDGETRALSVPTVRDHVVQTAVLQIIGSALENEFEYCSYAYRKGRSDRQAVFRTMDYYDQGYRWVVDADIDASFDNEEHAILLKKWKYHMHDPVCLRLMVRWLVVEVWDGFSLRHISSKRKTGC